VEVRLGKLDGEIAAMRALAEQDSARAEQRIKATVEDEKVKILEAAEQEIASATSHAQKQLQQYAAALAIEQAAHKLVSRRRPTGCWCRLRAAADGRRSEEGTELVASSAPRYARAFAELRSRRGWMRMRPSSR